MVAARSAAGDEVSEAEGAGLASDAGTSAARPEGAASAEGLDAGTDAPDDARAPPSSATGGASVEDAGRLQPDAAPTEAAVNVGLPRENPAQLTLEACELEEPCTRSLAQLVEGYSQNLDAERFGCVMQGLARGTPGRYAHETDATWTSGSLGARHTLVLRPDRTVLYSRVPYGYGPQPLDGSSEPGQRCRLRPVAYFESCLAAVEAVTCRGLGCEQADALDLAWACAFGDGDSDTPSTLDWFEACEEMTPLSCE